MASSNVRMVGFYNHPRSLRPFMECNVFDEECYCPDRYPALHPVHQYAGAFAGPFLQGNSRLACISPPVIA